MKPPVDDRGAVNAVAADLRAKLISYARLKGALPADAEEIAQEVLRSIHVHQPSHPLAYGKEAVRRQLLKLKARLGRERPACDTCPADTMEDPTASDAIPDLERIENLARLDAALEQFIVWGDEGEMHVHAPSLADWDAEGTRKTLRYYDAVLNRLPVCDRQHRRLAKRFNKQIRDAFGRSGYRLVPREEEADAAATERSGVRVSPPDPPDALGPPPPGWERLTVITNTVVARGMMLVQRLAPRTSQPDTLRIAEEAYRQIVEQDQGAGPLAARAKRSRGGRRGHGRPT